MSCLDKIQQSALQSLCSIFLLLQKCEMYCNTTYYLGFYLKSGAQGAPPVSILRLHHVVFVCVLSVFDLWLHICVSVNRAEKTEVLSDDLLQVNMTFFLIAVHIQQLSGSFGHKLRVVSEC